MISQETLQIMNTIGTWLASIGTLAAVIVSLYLARRDSRVKLKVSAGHRVLVTPGQSGTPDYCSIKVVNIGFRPANITGIGWKVGFYKKKYGIQTVYGHPASSKLPIKLDHGDEASYLIAFLGDGTYPNWIDSFPREFLPKNPKLNRLTIKVQAFTSIGKTFEAKIERGLRQKIIEAALKQQQLNH